MYSGFYTLASGILTRQNEIDVLGNNITNIKTPGYKTDRVETSAFEMELMATYTRVTILYSRNTNLATSTTNHLHL